MNRNIPLSTLTNLDNLWAVSKRLYDGGRGGIMLGWRTEGVSEEGTRIGMVRTNAQPMGRKERATKQKTNGQTDKNRYLGKGNEGGVKGAAS